MAIQDFTAGQVLTAAQMDNLQANDYNQTVSTKTANYVLVAADKGTRVVMNAAGATTITVNTSLFSAGDTLQLQNIGAGVCTVTAGTATVSSAGPLAIPQYGSGTLYFTSAGVSIFFPSAGPAVSSGLTLITSGTVSAGASVSILNAFSTTYDFYTMRFSNFQTANDNTQFNLQLGSSGSADTGANYNAQGYTVAAAISPITSSTNVSSFRLQINNGTTKNGLWVELAAPFLASATFFSASGFANYSGGGFGSATQGMLNTSTSYTDMFFSSNSGNIGPFTFALFGYAK
jgi:hypothetical protein